VSELVPPIQRSPMRLVGAVALAVVVVGGATAAVMRKPDPPVLAPSPTDTAETKLLFDRIRQLEEERKLLLLQIEKARQSIEELDRAKKQIEEKDAQIHELVDKLKAIKVQQTPAAQPKGPPATTNAAITLAINDPIVIHNLEGCFDEWAPRQALQAIEGVKREPPKEAQLLVKLGVNPEGTAHDAIATGERDIQHDGTLRDVHGSLSLCVEGAIGRAAYPKGSETLDLEVQIAWLASGIVNASAKIVARHEATSGGADL
jgi:hypothetical protein